MNRLFKPGDRVVLRSGGPVMEVLNYVLEYKPFLGPMLSNHKVRCVWYDPIEGRRTAIYHQRSLQKAYEPIPVRRVRKTACTY
ncbi:DUF2158 domain-containing protein [Fulvivirga imtechensis]|nr:DUF2158 domain-containing protein [Fulvivirga imtechensis]